MKIYNGRKEEQPCEDGGEMEESWRGFLCFKGFKHSLLFPTHLVNFLA
jgi:hypothetical protein